MTFWLAFLAGAGAAWFASIVFAFWPGWLAHRREREAGRARDARAMAAQVNLALGRPPVTEADVQRLLRQAGEGK